MRIDRRVFLVGAPLACVGAAAAILLYRGSTAEDPGEKLARAYEKYLDDVAANYRSGKVAVVSGWIVSEAEARTYRDLLAGD